MLRTMRRNMQAEEGGAAVEFAVLMFILVPLWLFTMFSSDAVFHMLDVQEAVLSATWDMSQLQWGGRSGSRDIGLASGMTRLQYADHDSSFTNESKVKYGSAGTLTFSDGDHHSNPFGHTCWCQEKRDDGSMNCPNDLTDYTVKSASHQVDCKVRGNLSFTVPPAGSFGGEVGGGGVVECGAKGWLYNYLIPDKFIGDFSAAEKIPLFTRKKQKTNSPHDNSGSSSTDILLRAHAGIMVNPWAITEKADGGDTKGISLGSSSGEFYRRTKVLYNYPIWYGLPSAQAAGFMAKAGSKYLGIAPAIPWGDPEYLSLPNILGLWMNVKYEGLNANSKAAYKDDDGFFTTPILPNSNEEKVFNNTDRGYYYMGKKKGGTS